MKFFPFLLILAGLVLSISSCEKFSGPTEVSGIVVDRHTSQPVAGAYVVAVGASSSLAGGGSTSPGTTADAQGRFAFSFEASAKSQYQVGTSTGSGYTNQGNGPLLKAGTKNDNLVVNADAPAWVRINCVDDPPYGKVGLFINGYLNGGENTIIGPGNSSLVRPEFSYTADSIYWEINSGQGKTVKGRLPYKTTAFDTAMVTIHF